MSNAPKPVLDPLIVSGEAEVLAETVTIPHAEQAQVLAPPTTIGRLYVEPEYEELEQEQRELWDAAGIAASREPHIQAATHQLGTVELSQMIADDRALVDDAREHLLRVNRVLKAFRRRAKGSKRWYQAAKACFIGGDLVGFGSAAIWLGELPVVALTLATSAAVATVAAGLIGSDVRDRELRRQRGSAVQKPTEAQQEFPHLFVADADAGVLGRMLLVAATTACTIGVGIAALRAAVDDPFIGLIFGGIALAVAGGSFLVSYAGTDEIADVIDHAEADYHRVVADHLRYAQHAVIERVDAAHAEEANILREHATRGAAASRHVRALKWGILRRNPSHAGHGLAPGRPAPVGGQVPRRDEVSV